MVIASCFLRSLSAAGHVMWRPHGRWSLAGMLRAPVRHSRRLSDMQMGENTSANASDASDSRKTLDRIRFERVSHVDGSRQQITESTDCVLLTALRSRDCSPYLPRT